MQVDEIEALESKCKQGVKDHSKRLKEISSQLKLAISEECGADNDLFKVSPSVLFSSNVLA